MQRLDDAVRRLNDRAERQPGANQLVQSFVDANLLERVRNTKHQVIEGRRGTGKTHLLRVLCEVVEEQIPVFVDMRTISSADSMNDETRPAHGRVLSAFRDVVMAILGALYDQATLPSGSTAPSPKIDHLERVLRDRTPTVLERTVNYEAVRKHSEKDEGRLRLSSSPELRVGGSGHDEVGEQVRESYVENLSPNVVYSDYVGALTEAIEATAPREVLLVLDEWSSIPLDLQPYLANILKHCIVPCQVITMKIGCVRTRTQLSLPIDESKILGLEMGADISFGVNLDEVHLYERHPDVAIERLGEVLLNHLLTVLSHGEEKKRADFVRSCPKFSTWQGMRDALFSRPVTFETLVQAAEGNIRDFMQIFAEAYAQKSGERVVENEVRDSASRIFKTSKLTHLQPAEIEAFDSLIAGLRGSTGDRFFLVDVRQSKHVLLETLIDRRTLHLMRLKHLFDVTDLPRLPAPSGAASPSVSNRLQRMDAYAVDFSAYGESLAGKQRPSTRVQERDEPLRGEVPIFRNGFARAAVVDIDGLDGH